MIRMASTMEVHLDPDDARTVIILTTAVQLAGSSSNGLSPLPPKTDDLNEQLEKKKNIV